MLKPYLGEELVPCFCHFSLQFQLWVVDSCPMTAGHQSEWENCPACALNVSLNIVEYWELQEEMLAGLNAKRITAEVEIKYQDFGKSTREKNKTCRCEGHYRSIVRKTDDTSRQRKWWRHQQQVRRQGKGKLIFTCTSSGKQVWHDRRPGFR